MAASKESLIVSAAKEAGNIAMSYFRNENTGVWYKSGNSPVSQADQEIDEYLRHQLLKHMPDCGWLSEETDDNDDRLSCNKLFIVDPIDGTRGFIDGQKEWCISIALVEDGRPTEGVLHCPALEKTFHAVRGEGFFVNGVGQSPVREKRNTPVVTGSKKLIETIRTLPGRPMEVMDFIPSLAYRLGLVASGELDAAFARPGASEWDIAAADIIIEEAGCALTDRNGKPVLYNCRNVKSPSLVAAPLETQREILALAKSTQILH